MPIVTYNQDNAYLCNEDGDPVGEIFREGDGLGPLIEERVNGWLALSEERDRFRKLLSDLLEWETIMGGWDSPVWRRAREALYGAPEAAEEEEA